MLGLLLTMVVSTLELQHTLINLHVLLKEMKNGKPPFSSAYHQQSGIVTDAFFFTQAIYS